MLLTESKVRAIVREMLAESMGHTMGHADPMQEGEDQADSKNTAMSFFREVAKILEGQKGVSAEVTSYGTEFDDNATALRIRCTGDSKRPIVTHRLPDQKGDVPGIFKNEEALYSAVLKAVKEAQKRFAKKFKAGEAPAFMGSDPGEFLSSPADSTEEVERPSDIVYFVAYSLD